MEYIKVTFKMCKSIIKVKVKLTVCHTRSYNYNSHKPKQDIFTHIKDNGRPIKRHGSMCILIVIFRF